MHIAEVVTIAKSLPLLRLNTYKSLILSYSVDYRRIFKEKYRQYETGEKGLDGGQYLYIFNLQGNPVRSFRLNRSVFGLSVNEKDGIVTCTTTDTDNPIVTLNL